MYVSKFALKTFVLLVNGPLLIWLIGVIGVKYTLLIYWTPLCWFHSDIRFNVSHASQKNMIQPSRPCVLYYRNTGFDQQSGACLRSQQMGLPAVGPIPVDEGESNHLLGGRPSRLH